MPLKLAKSGVKVALIEAEHVGWWCIGAQWRATQRWSLRKFRCGQGRLAGMGLAPAPDERALHGCKEEINMLGLANERRAHLK
jgi:hypothetical protein